MKSIHSFIRSLRVVPLLFTAALWSLPSSGRAQLYVSQDTTVGKYDAATGATINANFITGLNAPRGLALSGGNLYEANQSGTTIGKYDASTGAAINASFITVNNPRTIVVSGGTLFVTSGDSGGVVGKYDATTGATISAGFITGLTEPVGMAVSGSYLFVTDNNLNTVGKYDAATGAAINANFITGLSAPVGIFVSGNNLFVANAGGDTVGKYDATSGAAVNANFITGLATPAGIWVTDNVLYVSNNSGNTVGKYDATTGAVMNASFITGLTNPAFLVFAPPVPPIDPGELVAPRIAIIGSRVELTIPQTVFGRRYQVQRSETMLPGTWVDVGTVEVGDGGILVISISYDPVVPKRFYRLVLDPDPTPPGFALIPAGEFQMGDQSNPLVGYSDERLVHTVQVSAFYMGKYEVTKEEWDTVRAWGLTNGYTDLAVGNGSYASKGANHPVHSITWYDMVKWCNARSQKEALTPCYTVSGATYKTGQSAPDCNWNASGYRLPTEAEWEKAARGGVAGKNFPWGTDTISQSQANYLVYSSNGTTNYYSYDVTPRPPATGTYFYHPSYAVGDYPYSSPVGSFAPNGYGLYDMAGNMWEWCWDWYASYPSTAQTDPHGPATGSYRVLRGGCWGNIAGGSRCARRDISGPNDANSDFGFRLARGQP